MWDPTLVVVIPLIFVILPGTSVLNCKIHSQFKVCHPEVFNKYTNIQRDLKSWTQFCTSIFPEIYVVCEWST